MNAGAQLAQAAKAVVAAIGALLLALNTGFGVGVAWWPGEVLAGIITALIPVLVYFIPNKAAQHAQTDIDRLADNAVRDRVRSDARGD